MMMMIKPPISLTVTLSSISPTILLIATMLQPDRNHDDDDNDEFDLELEQWVHVCLQCQLAQQGPVCASTMSLKLSFCLRKRKPP